MPAHNEEQNIGEVIEEIKRDLPSMDVLVIDDASTDSTKELVSKQGMKCISLPFNLGYSLAVQTGIKYANIHHYDYVIQMDADGQHIPSEAKKLLKFMQKNNPDIVIGSRFLEQIHYKHGTMRKLGTNILSGLIKMICHKTIKDPTSGFQCMLSSSPLLPETVQQDLPWYYNDTFFPPPRRWKQYRAPDCPGPESGSAPGHYRGNGD